MIHVVLASNSNYFDGLAATLLSLLASNRNNTFGLHIIDGGLSPKEKTFLTTRARRFNPHHAITFHPLSREHFTGFRTDYGNSYMTYARIVVGSLLDIDRVIYLDTDLLIAADIRPLWETDLAGNVGAAAPDPGIRLLRDDYPFDDDCGDERYFNSGVMLIDLRRWRELKVQEQLLRMITEAPTKFKWWDQTAMNALFRRQVLFVDSRWNTFAESLAVRQPAQGAIFHYVGPVKPWNRCLEDDAYRVWRSFYAQHVRSQWKLYADRRFLLSFLQEKRHVALRESPVLRCFALGGIRLRAGLSGRSAAPQIADFQSRHSAAFGAEPASPAEIDAYVRHRWGSTNPGPLASLGSPHRPGR
jgi:lipopolysaccharide biosynthesis glycosyltransferase